MVTLSQQQLQTIKDNAELVYSASQIKTAVEKIGFQLAARITGKNPILLCVMNGGLTLSADLMRRMDCDIRFDYLQVARYRDKTTGGSLHWLKEPALSLENQTVVIIDDIYDEGYTMAELVSYCQTHGASEVISVALVLKNKTTRPPPDSRHTDSRHTDNRHTAGRPDVYGLQVDDRYVFGYGMDYKGYLRNMPAIYAVTQ